MKVSFIIPAFNCAAWLPHAVKSCQDQVYKDIEIVIIDDCSTDTTEQYINWLLKHGDKRIVYQRNGKNMGRSYSRNLGNKISTGEIICILDSDDLAISDRADWTVKKLKNCQVCYGSAITMDAIGVKMGEIIAGPLDIENMTKPMTNWKENLEKGKIELRENKIVHSTMGFLREIALKYPYVEGKVADLGIDDWQQQISMIRDGVKFDYIPDVICAYRVHISGISQTRNHLEVMKLKAQILEEVKCSL